MHYATSVLNERISANNIQALKFADVPHTVDDIECLLEACADVNHWTIKVFACKYFMDLAEHQKLFLKDYLHTIIPKITGLVYDSKVSVGEQSLLTLKNLYGIIENRDLEPFIPSLISALKNPDYVSETIHALSAVVFVQELQKPALSILIPLLIRGFQQNQTAVKRKCCIICENTCKLVDNPEDVGVFLSQLLPPIKRIVDEVADPECRQVASRVYLLLEKIINTKKQHYIYDASLDEGIDLCSCEFNLAYGSRILLNRSHLNLKKGKRYGVCGANGCGKSTLMKAIVNDQVDGFPTSDVLKRVYVEHDIDGNVADTPVFEFIGNTDTSLKALKAVGFDDIRLKVPVGSLSGGWKMKLALARAMMQNPDILLLDEPTNHLDKTNVEWLQNYLIQSPCTCLIVSHDSSFLDAVCTHIIHYENLKLKTYIGNLAAFVKKFPEACSYYELASTPMVFSLPEPGFLEGIKTKDKAILKMNQVSFQYQENLPVIIKDVSVNVSLSSRIGCIGPNGAGKSTLIKLLTGEIEPSKGSVWKHPNLRIAYVAQHAFHHIETHLDMTANEYIRWRYATGEDREAEDKVYRKLTDEEKALLEEKLVIRGIKRQFEKIIGRKKSKKSYEYEIEWKNESETSYLERDELIQLGFEKYVNEYDMKEAAQMGLMLKPLTQANVERHLSSLGLDSEIATHNRIRGYSGGQKVRLVVGAATWMNPHIIVLDEPSNYLDRDSLGAFANALKEYGGGIVIISHSKEFIDSICKEIWTVENGIVSILRSNENGILEKETVSFIVQDETIDAYGNTIKIKAPVKKVLSNKEYKAREKVRKARRARGEEVTDSETDD